MSEHPFEGVRTAVIDTVSLAYREQGQGEPVVFVHGSASDLRTWEYQLPAVGAAYRAIVYSRRYARPNEAIPEDADDPMLAHVDDLVALLERLDAVPATVVGHSWGGFVCLLAAIRHPEVVRSLVLLEPPVLSLFVSTPPRPVELLRTLVRRPRTALAIMRFGISTAGPAEKAYRRGDDEAGFEAFGRGVLGEEAFDRLSPARREQAWENVAVDKAQLLGKGFPPLSDDEVRGVRLPTLLMHGERSPAFLRLLTDRLEELLPRVDRVEIPGASHIMHEDNPQAVNEAILGFLKRP
ncbi:MAG: alpha/beta hydrolase [Myxococcales bacterium]|nr:alpha/beta hydrolase [Myxococcales bacterium]MDH3483756.1 alpha/beta hydrolase [Myxococcales bacterium]